MLRLVSKTSLASKAKRVAVFLGHQILATEGVIWLTILGSFVLRGSLVGINQNWVHSAFLRTSHLILSNTPYFPVQISLGAYLGWRFFAWWGHKSMLWVWVLPALLLTWALLVTVATVPWSMSAVSAILSHFFGYGCQADKGCYDQLVFTQPFYASAAYACGAVLAARKPALRKG